VKGSSVKVLGFALGSALAVGACSDPAASSTGTAASPQCHRLPGQRIDGLAWSVRGDRLAIVADDSVAGGVVSVLDPGRGTVRQLEGASGVRTLAGVSYGPHGVAWIEEGAAGSAIWSWDGDRTRPLARIQGDIYNLHETNRGFLGLNTTTERPVIVRLGLPNDPTGSATITPLFQPIGLIESDVAGDEGRLVYASHEEVGAPMTFVLRTSDEADDVYRPTSRFVGNPTLGVLQDQIYFEDHNAGALVEVDLSTDEARPAIRADVSEPALSGSGNIAYTFVDPKRTDTVCIQPTNPR
jgi:hypothetical protein